MTFKLFFILSNTTTWGVFNVYALFFIKFWFSANSLLNGWLVNLHQPLIHNVLFIAFLHHLIDSVHCLFAKHGMSDVYNSITNSNITKGKSKAVIEKGSYDIYIQHNTQKKWYESSIPRGTIQSPIKWYP